MQRVELYEGGAMAILEVTDPCDDGFGWCDQCDCRGSGHMGERMCS